jgi:hypothetical protein
MAITYPRLLLNEDLTKSHFVPMRYGQTSRDAGGNVSFTELYDARWQATYETKNLVNWLERQKWKAWLNSLRGGMKTFIGWDVSRRYPYRYQTGFGGLTKAGVGGAFTGTDVDVTALTVFSITLAQLPTNFEFSEGDTIGLTESGKYWMGEIMEAVTASSGGVVTVPVEPGIPTNIFTTAATAQVYRAAAELILMPDTIEGDTDLSYTPITFSAIQRTY